MTADDQPHTALDTQLDALTTKGLIRLAVERPELEYLFRHALVQDAAYGSLLKQERRDLHGRVGEALEQLYPERTGELAPVLAMHFEQAGDTEKAIDYFAAGGKHALQQNAIQEAYGAFDQASALIDRTPTTGPDGAAESPLRRRRRIEIKLGRASAGYSFLSADEAFDPLEDIIAEAEDLGDLALLARIHMLIALGNLQAGGSPTEPKVARSLARIEEIGIALADPSIQAMPLAFIGLSQVFNGPVREGVAALEKAVPLMQEQRDSIGAAFARGGLAIGYATLGEFEKADAAAANANELAKEGDLIAQLDALIAESIVRAQEGRLDLAVPLARECVDRAESTGASACILASSWVLGDALHRLGKFADARDILKRGADVSLTVDRRGWRPTLQAWLRGAAAALGVVEDGDLDEELATARSIGNRIGEAGILSKRAEARARASEVEPALADYAAAAAILEEQGARPTLARVLNGWGDTLRRAGRRDEATAPLERAAALFDELGLTREAGAVRTTLALGATTLDFG
jgi:tetratricopeptide (TPR) repeat protein